MRGDHRTPPSLDGHYPITCTEQKWDSQKRVANHQRETAPSTVDFDASLQPGQLKIKKGEAGRWPSQKRGELHPIGTTLARTADAAPHQMEIPL